MSIAENLKSKTDLPLIMAPMFLVSTPKLALAACAEGVVGSFPALNQRTTAGLEEWVVEMNAGLEKLRAENPDKKIAPYAVNLILAHPRVSDDVEVLAKYKVPVVITSLGIDKNVVDRIHAYGGIVLHDVTTAYHAKKAIAAGVDGIIAVAAGAGGHAGTLNPIALIDEIRSFYDGLLILSGAMSTGGDILAAQAMGADFAYMGTRFISTVEAAATDEHKEMISQYSAADLVYTAAISGVPANFLAPSLAKAGYDPDYLRKLGPHTGKLDPGKPSAIKKMWASLSAIPKKILSRHFKKAGGGLKAALAEKAVKKEAASWNKIWSAGQGIGNIHDAPPVATLITRMKDEYKAAQVRLLKKVGPVQSPQGPAR